MSTRSALHAIGCASLQSLSTVTVYSFRLVTIYSYLLLVLSTITVYSYCLQLLSTVTVYGYCQWLLSTVTVPIYSDTIMTSKYKSSQQTKPIINITGCQPASSGRSITNCRLTLKGQRSYIAAWFRTAQEADIYNSMFHSPMQKWSHHGNMLLSDWSSAEKKPAHFSDRTTEYNCVLVSKQ